MKKQLSIIFVMLLVTGFYIIYHSWRLNECLDIGGSWQQSCMPVLPANSLLYDQPEENGGKIIAQLSNNQECKVENILTLKLFQYLQISCVVENKNGWYTRGS